MRPKARRKYAPRLRIDKRGSFTGKLDPLHRSELRTIARHSRVTENFILDQILMDFFRAASPRFGEEY